jgi:hypothetical protein
MGKIKQLIFLAVAAVVGIIFATAPASAGFRAAELSTLANAIHAGNITVTEAGVITATSISGPSSGTTGTFTGAVTGATLSASTSVYTPIGYFTTGVTTPTINGYVTGDPVKIEGLDIDDNGTIILLSTHDSETLYIRSADNGAGNSGAISIKSGTASGTRGLVEVDGYQVTIDSDTTIDVTANGLTMATPVLFSSDIYLAPSTDNAYLTTATIVPTGVVMRVKAGGAGARTLISVPTIADGSYDGQILILQGLDDTTTLTLQDESNLADSALQLGGGLDCTLGAGDTLTLIWDDGDDNWYEISRSDN